MQDDISEEEIIKRREDYLKSLPENVVDDDKTLVVVINTGLGFQMQEETYYMEPDWNQLIQKYRNRFIEAAYGKRVE